MIAFLFCSGGHFPKSGEGHTILRLSGWPRRNLLTHQTWLLTRVSPASLPGSRIRCCGGQDACPPRKMD